MPTRPEILYPLFGQLTQFSGIGPKIALNLAKLNIDSPRDLIFTIPHSLLIRKKIKTILDFGTGEGTKLPYILKFNKNVKKIYACDISFNRLRYANDFLKKNLNKIIIFSQINII